MVEEALTAAGFRDVRTRVVPSPVRMASAEECLRFERESFGALHQMLSGLDEEEREAAWDEVGEALPRSRAPRGSRGRAR